MRVQEAKIKKSTLYNALFYGATIAFLVGVLLVFARIMAEFYIWNTGEETTGIATAEGPFLFVVYETVRIEYNINGDPFVYHTVMLKEDFDTLDGEKGERDGKADILLRYDSANPGNAATKEFVNSTKTERFLLIPIILLTCILLSRFFILFLLTIRRLMYELRFEAAQRETRRTIEKMRQDAERERQKAFKQKAKKRRSVEKEDVKNIDDNRIISTPNTDNATVPDNTVPEPDSEKYFKGFVLNSTYVIESKPIQGGMGNVWKVHHKDWDVDLAMKRPKAEHFKSDEQKETFSKECNNWIKLGLHPNIVSCYYVREIDGTPTIFSEWMDYGSLEDRIKEKELYDGTPEEVQERLLDIAIQTARGLHYAHENKLIHRDVKPDNVLLNRDWTAKVSDFGLTKAKSMLTFLDGTATKLESYEGAAMLSSSNVMSPPYCSPEQASAQLLTIRTDIYSWAVSVLEMYLGDKPWAHGRDRKGPVVGQQYRYYFNKCVDRPVPKALQELLAKCLELDPDDRPEDFAVVESELKSIYLEKTGSPYPRSEPDTASDTAESLNNRALSYLDLGLNDKAEELFKEAIEKDGSRFLYHYNYALYCWNQHRMSDRTLMEYLDRNRDSSDLCKKKMDILSNMRGRWDKGAKQYSYHKDKRPENLEPLLQPSATSVDGEYRVNGYEEKDDHGIMHYGYRIEKIDTGEIWEYPNEYDDYRVPTGLKPQHCKSSNAYFVGPHSEYVVMEAKTMWFFESKTGRLVLSMPPVMFLDFVRAYDYYIVGYTQSGVIEYSWVFYDRVEAIRMCADETLFYELAEFSTTDSRLDMEKRLGSNYEEALSCWNRNDVAGTYRALKRSLEGQVLTMHEPSLHLWSKLREYYEPDSLITVVPTQDIPTPLPIRNECKKNQLFTLSHNYRNASNNGQTFLQIIRRQEYEHDFSKYDQKYMVYYTLYATDIRSGNSYFSIKHFEEDSHFCINYPGDSPQANYMTNRYLGLEGDHMLWYAVPDNDGCMIDLMEMSRKCDGRVSFALPGGYWLKNTKEGVDIGGVVFKDIFTDFRPLWDSDVIACRDKNYRLVFRYKEKE